MIYELTKDDLEESAVLPWLDSLGPEQQNSLWHFHVVNNALASKGWIHEISDWWTEVLEDFYESGVRSFWARVGRRGGKSSTICRLLVAEALLGSWCIPQGDKGVVAIVSKDRKDAASRLDTIEEILKALGFQKCRDEPKGPCYYSKRTQEIEIQVIRNGRPSSIVFAVFAASKKGVVGFTAIMVLLDEVTRWVDVETGDNPAREVLRSIRPSLLTQDSSKLIGISSPWATLDLHYQHVEKGHTDKQRAYSAPTWVANPTMTIEKTRALAEDEIEWDREYNNVPMASDEVAFFDGALIDQSVGLFEKPLDAEPYAGGDFGFTKNASSVVEVWSDGKQYSIELAKAMFPRPGQPLRPMSAIRYLCQGLSAESLMSDSHYQETQNEALEDFNIARVPSPTESKAIHDMYVHMRKLLTCAELNISPGVEERDRLVQQLKEVKRKPTVNSWQIILRADGYEHGDVADAAVKACWHAYSSWADPSDEATAPYRLTETTGKPTSLSGYTAEQWYQLMGDPD